MLHIHVPVYMVIFEVVLFSRVSPHENFNFNAWLFILMKTSQKIVKLNPHEFANLVQNRENICTRNIWCMYTVYFNPTRKIKGYFVIFQDLSLA